MSHGETPYIRESGYAERYRDRRFTIGGGRRTDRREARAIGELLALTGAASAGSTDTATRPWLDVPSGAGRLSHLLPGPVIRADRDFAMLVASGTDHPRVCASIHRLPFAGGSFAGVLCMRLLHHIPDAAERRHILAELGRVTTGPVLVSFFDAMSLQHARRALARRLGKTRSGRCAIRYSVFRADLHAAGLTVIATRPLLRFVSEQWLVLARPRPAQPTTVHSRASAAG